MMELTKEHPGYRDYEDKLVAVNRTSLWKTVTKAVFQEALQLGHTVDYGCGMTVPPSLLSTFQRSRIINFEPTTSVAAAARKRTDQPVIESHAELYAEAHKRHTAGAPVKSLVLNQSISHIENLDELCVAIWAMKQLEKVFVVVPNSTFYRLRRPLMTQKQYKSDSTVLRALNGRQTAKIFENWGHEIERIEYAGDYAYRWTPEWTRSRAIVVVRVKR